jgi:hypothetical protein
MESTGITINVKFNDNKNLRFSMKPTDTFLNLKEKIYEKTDMLVKN